MRYIGLFVRQGFVFLGFEGTSLYEASLLRRGYHLANIVIARDANRGETSPLLLRTEQSD